MEKYKKKKVRGLTLSTATAGLMVAIGILLPFAVSHGFGMPGTLLLPMHIPVLLCGFLCGPLFGSICGLITPLLSSLFTGMPAMFPMLPIMMGELFTYGLVSGLLTDKTKMGQWKFGSYPILILSMLCGRVVYGIIFSILTGIYGPLTKALSVWGAITAGIGGIIIQLVLIPPLVTALRLGNAIRSRDALASARSLIREGTATCVVIKNNRIIKTELGRGIAPMIAMNDCGALDKSVVADKIVGKAAAMLMVLGGAQECWGETVSNAAVAYLKKNHIRVHWQKKVDYIVNRTGDGMCPMELTVKDLDDPEEALCALKAKLEELRLATSKASQ